MTDPGQALRTAIYAALTVAPLVYNGATVPVFGPLAPAGQAAPYVVLSTDTATSEEVAAACVAHEVTLLIDVVTDFAPGTKNISAGPACAIAALILPRLTAKGFAIGDYTVVARANALSETLPETTATEITVRRLMRVRYRLIESVTA